MDGVERYSVLEDQQKPSQLVGAKAGRLVESLVESFGGVVEVQKRGKAAVFATIGFEG